MGYGTIITVADANEKIVLGYSTIEVWACIDGGTVYNEITAASPTAAFLASDLTNGFPVGGTRLAVAVDGQTAVAVDFDQNLAVWSAAQVAERINEMLPNIASAVGGTVYLTSRTTGRGSSIEVPYDEMRVFPFRPAYGKDSRLALTSGKYVYEYTDVSGTPSTRYKWRFSKNGAMPISPFALRVFGDLNLTTGLPLSVATARFSGIDGKPVVRRVIVSGMLEPALQGGFGVGDATAKTYESDFNGFLQIPLVQGVRVKVAIEGTTYVRDFVVPSSDSFDLLAVMAASGDPFEVQTTAPLLTRRHI